MEFSPATARTDNELKQSGLSPLVRLLDPAMAQSGGL